MMGSDCCLVDLQQLILAFTGNGNFNPSTTGLNGSPQGFLVTIVKPSLLSECCMTGLQQD